MRRSRVLLAAVAVGGTFAVKRRADSELRKWEQNPDPTGGAPMVMPPDGEEIEVQASDGARLRGTAFGEGPVVLLIHGYTGTIGHYAPVAVRLVESGFRVIAVEQRGHGRSERGELPFAPETLAADVASWLEDLDLRDVVVSGHSMGGMAAMAFAAHHPEVAAERVRAMVLVATLASPPSNPNLPDMRIDLSAYANLIERPMRMPDHGLFLLRNAVGNRPSRAHMEAARETFLATAPRTRTEAAKMLNVVDIRDRLPSIAVPVHIVVGSHDRITYLHMNEEIAGLIPGATIDVLPGLGHMLAWEAPDAVTDAIVQAAKPR